MSTGGISGDHSHSSENYDIFFFEDLAPHLNYNINVKNRSQIALMFMVGS